MAELIATVPLQLGYRPERSLVLIFLEGPDEGSPSARPAGRIRLICRMDLPEDAGAFEETLEAIHQIVWQHQPGLVGALSYEADEDATAILAAVASTCVSLGSGVYQLARVRSTRWLALCPGQDDPGVWRELPSTDRVPAAAELIWHGACTGPSREELTAVIRGGDATGQASLAEEIDAYLTRYAAALPDDGPAGTGSRSGSAERPQVADRFLERAALAWRRLLDPTPEGPAVTDLPPAVVAQGLVFLWDRGFRDALIAWVAPGQLGPGLLPPDVLAAFVRHLPASRLRDRARLDRLVTLCGLVRDDCAAPILTVTGQVAWAINQGTVANIAIERAREVDPDYHLAILTSDLLRAAIPPPPGPFARGA